MVVPADPARVLPLPLPHDRLPSGGSNRIAGERRDRIGPAATASDRIGEGDGYGWLEVELAGRKRGGGVFLFFFFLFFLSFRLYGFFFLVLTNDFVFLLRFFFLVARSDRSSGRGEAGGSE